MNKTDFLIDRIKNINKVHLTLLLICSIAVSSSLEIFDKSEIEKEISKFIETFQSSAKKVVLDFNPQIISQKEEIFKQQILNEFKEDAIIWKDNLIQDQISLNSIYTLEGSINDVPIYNLFNILLDTVTIIKYPKKIFDCLVKDDLEGPKETIGYLRTDIPKITSLKIENNILSVNVYERFLSSKQLITNKGRRQGFRRLTCNCLFEIDSIAIFNNSSIEKSFPFIQSDFEKLRALTVEQILSKEKMNKKEELLKKEVKFLSVSFKLRNIALAVSFLVIGLLLLILSGITDIRKKIENLSKEFIELDFFKSHWVGLMDNKYSFIFTIFTVILFPLFSTILSIYTYTKVLIFPLFAGILILILSSLILKECIVIKKITSLKR